ncbi:MAG: protein kinase [Planctomycetes bacterium]|nr:protein kinase [Planctomycetota bacterium]
METKRYCGKCLLEIAFGQSQCPHCGWILPWSGVNQLAAGAPPAGDGSNGTSATGASVTGASATGTSTNIAKTLPRALPLADLEDGETLTQLPAAAPRFSREPEVAVENEMRDAPAEAIPEPAGAAQAPPAVLPPAPAPAPADRGADALDTNTVGDFQTVGPVAAEDVSQSWREGQLVAERFRIVRCIGQGGMGKVYMAQDEILGRLIALKRVPQEIIYDNDARDDLRQETNRLLDLAHENIIRVHTYYDEPAWPFFAMEYLQGPTLKELLRARKQEGRFFSVDELLAIAKQVGNGLTYAHSKNLIHRDLKPANLMLAAPPSNSLTESDVVKITDFGISQVIADSTMRQTGKRSGTLPYMSPEQYRGEECTAQSDTYSLAATFYELLSGRPPFYTGDIGYQILHLHPKPMASVPKGMNEVILKGLRKNPRDRYASVAEFVTALEKKKPAPQAAPPSALFKRLGVGLAVAASALILAAGIWRIGVYQPDQKSGAPDAARPGLYAGKTEPPPVEKMDTQALFSNLQKQLDEGFPAQINSRTVVLQIRQEGELRRFPTVSWDLMFILDPEGAKAKKVEGRSAKEPDGSINPLVHEFHLVDLSEGFHRLRAVFQDGTYKSFPSLADLRVEKSFEVDATGPIFQIEPVKREAFVEISPNRYTTFNEECELRLVTPGTSGDIAKAFYRMVFNGLLGDAQPIADPMGWKVQYLSQGQNTFKVFAKDKLGNNSPEVDLRIDRLHLSVDEFTVDRLEGIKGNQVYVQGRLNAEGSKLPALKFFINENLVPSLKEDYVEPSFENPNFRTRLTLPRFSNTIEVRYEWGGKIFPFALPARISDIQVVAPAITHQLPKATREPKVEVAGKVKPYFDGLAVTLNHKGVSSRRMRLVLSSDLSTAEFTESILLAENQINSLAFECSYDGRNLEPAVPVAEIYCDRQPPTLLDRMEFEQRGAYLHVRLLASEPLSQLRIREGDMADWKLLVRNQDGYYLHRTELPRQKILFTAEMIDMVGNANTVSELCPVADVEGIVTPKERLDPDAGVAPAGFRQEGQSCPFLKEIGLEFKAFGKEGVEMSTTEVTERAWTRYLKERSFRRGEEAKEGSLDLPMTLVEADENLLLGFTDWLSDKCKENYRYYIPTPEEWRCAFAGTADPQEAAGEILNWFQGASRRGKSYNPNPKNRYYSEQISRIGSRLENRTPSGLLDMESNLQELVRDLEGRFGVIGGWNLLRESELSDHCLKERPFKLGSRDPLKKYTGLRVARKTKDSH